jgi:hypothetical protein
MAEEKDSTVLISYIGAPTLRAPGQRLQRIRWAVPDRTADINLVVAARNAAIAATNPIRKARAAQYTSPLLRITERYINETLLSGGSLNDVNYGLIASKLREEAVRADSERKAGRSPLVHARKRKHDKLVKRSGKKERRRRGEQSPAHVKRVHPSPPPVPQTQAQVVASVARGRAPSPQRSPPSQRRQTRRRPLHAPSSEESQTESEEGSQSPAPQSEERKTATAGQGAAPRREGDFGGLSALASRATGARLAANRR